MARAEIRRIMSDRLVGGTGGTVTRMARNTGGESTSGLHDMMYWSPGILKMIYDFVALAALTNLICMF
jgi:hypothetical protein